MHKKNSAGLHHYIYYIDAARRRDGGVRQVYVVSPYSWKVPVAPASMLWREPSVVSECCVTYRILINF